jgi:hypothetical protein
MLRSAPKTVTWNGCTVNNPSADKLVELGYKPVVYTDMPTDAETGKHYESSWTETEAEITQVWNLADDPVYPEPEPTPEERLDKVEQRTDTLETTTDDIVLMMADFIGGNE